MSYIFSFLGSFPHFGGTLPIIAFQGLEMTLESPLDSKEIKPVNPKGNQP